MSFFVTIPPNISVARDLLDQSADLGLEGGIVGEDLLYRLVGVDAGRVVLFVDNAGDIMEGHIGQLAENVNKDVTRRGDLLFAVLGHDLLAGHVVMSLDGGKNLINGNGNRLVTAHQLDDTAFGKLNIDLTARKKRLRAQLFDRALDLSDIGAEIFG